MTTNTLNHKNVQQLWKTLIDTYLKKVIKDKNEKVSPKKTKQNYQNYLKKYNKYDINNE